MDITTIEGLITSLGFPVACVIGLAVFIVHLVKTLNAQNQEHLDELKQDSHEREEKLYEQIEKNTAINGQFASIIAKYDIKLDHIEHDIKDIKNDVTIVKTKIEQ